MSKVAVGICMGSSCFSRGNKALVTSLREAFAREGIENRVELKGFLCIDACDKGPCVTIDDERVLGLAAHDILLRVQDILKEKK
jgi:NADH:ubiquinone oxidoreductase subunit E